MKILSDFWPKSKRRRISVIFLLLIFAYNFKDLTSELKRVKMLKGVVDRQDVEYKYTGLLEFTKGIEYIGYFTDSDLSQKVSNKEFSHAQYVLAPSILVPNELEYEYILFVCKNKQLPWIIMKHIGAEPLLGGNDGMILARRKNGVSSPEIFGIK